MITQCIQRLIAEEGQSMMKEDGILINILKNVHKLHIAMAFEDFTHHETKWEDEEQTSRNRMYVKKDIINQQELTDSTEGLQLMMFRSEEMIKNYHQLLGFIYAYTSHLEIAVVAGFVLIAHSQEYMLKSIKEENWIILMFLAFKKLNQKKEIKIHEKTIFFVHTMKELYALVLIQQAPIVNFLKKQAQIMENRKAKTSNFTYEFLIDSRFINNLLQKMQFYSLNQEIKQILRKMISTDNPDDFNKNIINLIVDVRKTQFKEKKVIRAIEKFINLSTYFCKSQFKLIEKSGKVKICEQFLQKSESKLKQFKKTIYEQILSNMNNFCRKYNGSALNKNVVIYKTILVMLHHISKKKAKEVEQISKEKKNARMKIGEALLVEEQIPELKTIRMLLNAKDFEILIRQIFNSYKLSVKPFCKEVTLAQITNNPIIQNTSTIFYQSNHTLPFIIFDKNFMNLREKQLNFDSSGNFIVKGNSDKFTPRWDCSCKFKDKYGIPCSHQIKVCLLTSAPLCNQLTSLLSHSQTEEELLEMYRLNQKNQSKYKARDGRVRHQLSGRVTFGKIYNQIANSGLSL